MRKAGVRQLLVTCALYACGVMSAHGAGTKGGFTEQLKEQSSIYRSQDQSTLENYTVDRNLELYADGLATGFEQFLNRLGPDDRWLDIGAGQGQAILDYLGAYRGLTAPDGVAPKRTRARAVAMSIEDRTTDLWRQTAARLGAQQLQYLWGKPLRDYAPDDIGRFRLITDVIGGFSYTDNLSRYMEGVLSLLEVNGEFYSVLQDVHRESGGNKPYYEGSPYLTELVDAKGGEVKICAWLKRIACAEVRCESKAAWRPPVESFRVRKTCDAVSVPALSPMHYQAGTPPERRFLLRD